jgi:hypothetical protein
MATTYLALLSPHPWPPPTLHSSAHTHGQHLPCTPQPAPMATTYLALLSHTHGHHGHAHLGHIVCSAPRKTLVRRAEEPINQHNTPAGEHCTYTRTHTCTCLQTHSSARILFTPYNRIWHLQHLRFDRGAHCDHMAVTIGLQMRQCSLHTRDTPPFPGSEVKWQRWLERRKARQPSTGSQKWAHIAMHCASTKLAGT